MKSCQAVLVLGDQLSLDSPALDKARREGLTVIMVESAAESKVVWVHKARIAIFVSAMRHFAAQVQAAGIALDYSNFDQTGERSLVEQIFLRCKALGVERLSLLEPGEWRLEQDLIAHSRQHEVALNLLDDPHFMCSRSEFSRWASKYKQLRMEFFYRYMRQQHNVLMDGKEPCGGKWNYDAENRKAFPKGGPGEIPEPAGFEPDDITQRVFAEVESRFADHPGKLDLFRWPVTREQALTALDRFVESRLAGFGNFQDAMWTDLPFGWHSLLASSINLHLLDPREVIEAAVRRYAEGKADLASVEGFVRQILGWREFIRGVYWLDMPAMRQANHLKADLDLPDWFWTGKTHMNCLSQSIGQTLDHGYAHHIQRLMVIGNFAVLAGLSPQQVEDWFLSVYVDAVEWVELPNVAGMALFANGGRFTSKPYVSAGAYINRMSNYCAGCKYKPAERVGDKACPYTTLYWNFLDKNEDWLGSNPRTSLMARNVNRIEQEERQAIRERAGFILSSLNSI